MSLGLVTRILHVKDGDSYDTIDMLRGPKGDGSDIDVDDALSPSSENPVQNKVVTGAVNDLVMVSEQQPSSGNNKLWIEEDGTYVDLPTVGELNEVGSNIASAYDNSATYAVGEYCLHDRIAYRCTTAISTPEAWNAAHWTRTIIGDEITELNEDITELSQTVDGKAPAIIVTSEQKTNHYGLGTYSHEVEIMPFDNVQYGNAIYADSLNLVDCSGQDATTKNGVTVTPLANNAFVLSGTTTTASGLCGDFFYDYETVQKEPLAEGEKLIVKIFSTCPIRCLVRAGGIEIRDYTLSTTNTLVTMDIYKTIPADFDNHVGLRFGSTTGEGVVFDNEMVWVGIYHEGTNFVDLGEPPVVSFNTRIPVVNTLYYLSEATYLADTKEYVDSLDVDINEKLTYVTPERFYGGYIPLTVDAAQYISQAVEYGILNNIPIYCGGKYSTANMITVDGNDIDLFIKEIDYTGNSGYAIKYSGKRSRICIDRLISSANGLGMYGSSTKDSSHNEVDILYANCTGHCLHIFAENATLTEGVNSYNTINILRGNSSTGNAIRFEEGSGAAENTVNGRYVKTNSSYAIWVATSGNTFYNFCLEADAYMGIYTGSSNSFINFRTSEGCNNCARNNRKFVKLLPGYTVNVKFVGRAPVPYSIDVSDVLIPPENWQYSETSGHTYSIVATPSVMAENYNGRMASYYDVQSPYYENWAGSYYYNMSKKLICTLKSGHSLLNVGVSNINMNSTELADFFDINADCTIILSPSYCAEAISEFVVDQTHGYTATIEDNDGGTVFDGAQLGSGKFRVRFFAEKVPYTPVSTTYYTYFFGENSTAVIEKISESSMDLIADVTTSENLANVTVSTDINGESFALKKGIIIVEAPQTTTGSRDNLAAQGKGANNNSTNINLNFPSAQWYGSATASVFYYEFDCNGIAPQYTRCVVFSAFGSTAGYTQQQNFINVDAANYLKLFKLVQYNSNSSLIPSGTRIRIYGQRYVQ